MRQLKEEALALVGTFAAVCIGSLVFVTLTMPFVFPFVVVAAGVLTWRQRRRSKPAPRTPLAGPPRPVKRIPGRQGPHALPA